MGGLPYNYRDQPEESNGEVLKISPGVVKKWELRLWNQVEFTRFNGSIVHSNKRFRIDHRQAVNR